MRVQGIGHRRGQGELPDLLPHIPRHKLDRGLHFRHHALGFVDPIQAGLRETFVLRTTTNAANLCADIGRNEPTISSHAALQIDHVVDLAARTDALGDLLALRADEARRPPLAVALACAQPALAPRWPPSQPPVAW